MRASVCERGCTLGWPCHAESVDTDLDDCNAVAKRKSGLHGLIREVVARDKKLDLAVNVVHNICASRRQNVDHLRRACNGIS